MPDETPPADDWSFPPVEPVEPAPPVLATPPYDVPTEPALPPAAQPVGEPVAEAPSDLPSAGVMPVPRRHPAQASPVSPLRALAGAAVAVAGVLLGIGALLWATDGPKGTPTLETQVQSTQLSASPSPSPAPSAAASPADVSPVPAPVQTTAAPSPAVAPKLPLTVLNNSNRTGLAKRAAAKYAAAGWPIKLTGSFRGRVTATTVYYAPGQQASALALQKAFPAIERVRPRFAGLPGSGLTVVLIRSYPA